MDVESTVHAAARSADGGEGVPITPSRKLLRSGKGQGQLCLLFATEDEGDRPLVGHSIMPLETIPPTLLSLEF